MLRVGTDCSGIEAPIQALLQMGIPFEHVFSCEIDKFARKSIEANYKPKKLYEDIMLERTLEDIDLYVCGFPCTPFSSAGKMKSFEDPRANIFPQCVKVIKEKKPKIFILENVKSLTQKKNKPYYDYVNTELCMEEYNVTYTFMNTKDYGIPQNRARLYIIGIRKDIQKKDYQTPKVCGLIKPLKAYIDTTDTKVQKPSVFMAKYLPELKGVFICSAFLKAINPDNYQTYSPTLTAQGSFWCKPMNRKMNVKERLRLQGFPEDFKQVVSKSQMEKQIGNSMSVNVLVKILEECLSCV